jgi:hypothetical protein
METATRSPSGHHAGLLIFDEPRQQETAHTSLAALIQELRVTTGEGNQVLYATSGNVNELEPILEGVDHFRMPAPGQHLLSPVV